jgi:hypothetical protein
MTEHHVSTLMCPKFYIPEARPKTVHIHTYICLGKRHGYELKSVTCDVRRRHVQVLVPSELHVDIGTHVSLAGQPLRVGLATSLFEALASAAACCLLALLRDLGVDVCLCKCFVWTCLLAAMRSGIMSVDAKKCALPTRMCFTLIDMIPEELLHHFPEDWRQCR